MTVIPIKWKENEDLKQVAHSISFFPVVGLIIGFTNYGLFYLSNLIFSSFFTSVLIVIWWIFITGGLHLDGLADTADGVWGGTTKERRLEIMKDSRTGVFGVLTLISFLLLKIAILNEFFTYNISESPALLITAPVLGRWISVFSIFYFKSARKDGLGNFFKENISWKELLLSLILTLLFVFYFTGPGGLITLFIITILSVPVSLFFSSKLGGLTGDVYGTLCESSELFSLIFIFILISIGFPF